MISTEPLESNSVAMSPGRRAALSFAFAFTLAIAGAALLPATVVRAQNTQDSQQAAARDDDAIQSDVAYALLHSQAWMQILADVLGRPLLASTEPEASSRGVALLVLETLGLNQ